MAEFPDGDDLQARINQWHQGDCVLGNQAMYWGFHPDRPLTHLSREAAPEADPHSPPALVAGEVEGLVVLSQRCDIVRDFSERPYVQVAPLVRLKDAGDVAMVKRRSQPKYAYLPALADTGLVAELDRVFTVEKSMLARWERTQGCVDDKQRRSLHETIRRYYSRAALPNAFVQALEKLRTWFQKRHDVSAPTGECLRALEMLLVRARPSWMAERVHVDILLIRASLDDGLPERSWETFRETCRTKVTPPPGYEVAWHLMLLAHLSAQLYLESELLDLEHLSDSART